jgi:hypothetical protein
MSSMSVNEKADSMHAPRQTYAKPALRVYGTVGQLTRTVGHGKKDREGDDEEESRRRQNGSNFRRDDGGGDGR